MSGGYNSQSSNFDQRASKLSLQILTILLPGISAAILEHSQCTGFGSAQEGDKGQQHDDSLEEVDAMLG